MEENVIDAKFALFPKKQNVVPLFPNAQTAGGSHVPAYPSVEEVVSKLRPTEPVHCLREHSVYIMTDWFLRHFPGEVMFAVKTNPEPVVLEAAYSAGMRHFDVASLAEAELVYSRFGSAAPGAANIAAESSDVAPRSGRDANGDRRETFAKQQKATMHFMHPVKSREAIAKAYYYYGIRHFSLDSYEELEKILSATENAPDLSLSVRLAVANDKAAYSLGGKFGVAPNQAVELVKATRAAASKLGLCFHVGSQCMDPAAYIDALKSVRTLLEKTRVKLDILDIGGGFPSIYPDKTPPAMMRYMEAIGHGLQQLPLSKDCQIFAEPGRALVAEAGSLIVRVELKKGDALYINDGVYGSLFDAGAPGFIYPTKAIRPNHRFENEMKPFKLYGPTCDSVDAMPGPFMLPADIEEGDWIEIGGLGAYGATMRTKFNGFYSDALVKVEDEALLRMSLFENRD